MQLNKLLRTATILTIPLIMYCKPDFIPDKDGGLKKGSVAENPQKEETEEHYEVPKDTEGQENEEQPATTGEDIQKENPSRSEEEYSALIRQHMTGNRVIRTYKDFTLEWDNGSRDIEIKYRRRFSLDWNLLGVSGINEFVVSGLDPGLYEFAVYDRQLDVMHTSTEIYAQPETGWFVMYKMYPEADANLDGIISREEMKSFIDRWFNGIFTNSQFSVNADYYASQE